MFFVPTNALTWILCNPTTFSGSVYWIDNLNIQDDGRLDSMISCGSDIITDNFFVSLQRQILGVVQSTLWKRWIFSLEIKSKTMNLIYYEWLNNLSDFKIETKMFCNQKFKKVWLSSYINMIYLSVRIRLTSCIHHTFPFKQFFKWLNTYCFLLQQHRAKLTGQEWTIGDVSSADLRGEIIEIVNFDLLSLEQQRSPCK